MNITKHDFFNTGIRLNLSKEQVQEFWSALEQNEPGSASSSFSRYLFYFGALIVISAMSWFITIAFESFGGGGIFLISLSYAAIFLIAGHLMWNKKHLRTPAGLLITMAVCMIPLGVYGLENYLKLWSDDPYSKFIHFFHIINGRWLSMEMITILFGLIAIYFYPFPFLTAPIFLSSWFLTMDIVPALFGEIGWKQQCWISLFFGILLIMLGVAIDRKKKEDYGFWSYFFGALSFWGALNCLVWDKGEAILFVYLIINIVMMFLSILLERKILMIYGTLGIFLYISHLAFDIFGESVLFTFALSFVGLSIIALGILYQKNATRIEQSVKSFFKKGK